MSSKKHQYLADFYKAFSHPARLQILDLLRHGERCVCEIVPEMGMEQPNVSRHLSILRKEGLLGYRKDGLRVIYWVRDHRIYQLIDSGGDILKSFWKEKNEEGTYF